MQLATGALYTSAHLLLRRLGLDWPERAILAGAFGSVLDPRRALAIGLFPARGVRQVRSVGNAAGDGARLALLDKDKRAEAEPVAREVEYVKLTLERGFNEAFIAALYFPAPRARSSVRRSVFHLTPAAIRLC